jgi:hypothetical protein
MMRQLPFLTWLLGIPGLACLATGLAVFSGLPSRFHPLLADPGTGLALVVSAIALLGSAAFPLVISRLAAQDETTR